MGTARQSMTQFAVAFAHELVHLLISKLEHTNTASMQAYLNQSDFRKARKRELRLTASKPRSRNSTLPT